VVHFVEVIVEIQVVYFLRHGVVSYRIETSPVSSRTMLKWVT